jgi:hypothetical protein
MAFPVIESYSTDTTGGTNNTTVSLTQPTGLAVNDLILVLVLNDQANVFDWPAIVSPDAYTQLGHANNANDAQGSWYWRIATGTETWPLTISGASGDYAVGWCMRISNVATSTPINAGGIWTLGASASSGTIPAITTDVDDCLIVAAIGGDGSDMSPFTFSGTGWIADQSLEDPTDSIVGCGATWGQKNLSTSGSSSGCDWSSGFSDGWIGAQIAIAPGEAVAATILPQMMNYLG